MALQPYMPALQGSLGIRRPRNKYRNVAESYLAFNEGIRLKDCIRMQQKLMNVRVRCVAADSIYANNVNRKFYASSYSC